MPLPSVKYETVFNLLSRVRGDAPKLFDQFHQEVDGENPELLRSVKVWCEQVFPGRREREMGVNAALLMYALLKSQAGADALAEELSGRMG
jgi:hypothetical protein